MKSIQQCTHLTSTLDQQTFPPLMNLWSNSVNTDLFFFFSGGKIVLHSTLEGVLINCTRLLGVRLLFGVSVNEPHIWSFSRNAFDRVSCVEVDCKGHMCGNNMVIFIARAQNTAAWIWCSRSSLVGEGLVTDPTSTSYGLSPAWSSIQTANEIDCSKQSCDMKTSMNLCVPYMLELSSWHMLCWAATVQTRQNLEFRNSVAIFKNDQV